MVSQLLDHVAALKARISELEGRQKPPTEGGKERKPPSWAKANRPDPPKKERRNRAHGFARRQEEPTHRVEHATASCPDCGTLLLGGRVRGGRQIISIPRVRTRVTEPVVLERTCRKCGQRWSPEPDWSALVVGRQRVGRQRVGRQRVGRQRVGRQRVGRQRVDGNGWDGNGWDGNGWDGNGWESHSGRKYACSGRSAGFPMG